MMLRMLCAHFIVAAVITGVALLALKVHWWIEDSRNESSQDNLDACPTCGLPDRDIPVGHGAQYCPNHWHNGEHVDWDMTMTDPELSKKGLL